MNTSEFLKDYNEIKRLIQEDDITGNNTYAPNTGDTKYIQQVLTDSKGGIDENII